eukprot:1143358-Pyramimonas_sp.AAC.2
MPLSHALLPEVLVERGPRGPPTALIIIIITSLGPIKWAAARAERRSRTGCPQSARHPRRRTSARRRSCGTARPGGSG